MDWLSLWSQGDEDSAMYNICSRLFKLFVDVVQTVSWLSPNLLRIFGKSITYVENAFVKMLRRLYV